MKNEKNEELKSKAIINMYMAVDDINKNLIYIFTNKIELRPEAKLDNRINIMVNSFFGVAEFITGEIQKFARLHDMDIIDPGSIEENYATEITLDNQLDFLGKIVGLLEDESVKLQEVVDSLEKEKNCQALKVMMQESAGNILHNILKFRSEIAIFLLY